MIKGIKTGTTIILILLALAALVLVAFGGLAALIIVAIGYLFLYYALLLVGILVIDQNDSCPAWLEYLLLILFSIPLLWLLINPYGLGEWLMSDIKLDMK